MIVYKLICDRGKIEMNDELYMIRPYKNHHVFFKPIDNPLYHQHINFNDSSHHKHVYEGKINSNAFCFFKVNKNFKGIIIVLNP